MLDVKVTSCFLQDTSGSPLSWGSLPSECLPAERQPHWNVGLCLPASFDATTSSSPTSEWLWEGILWSIQDPKAASTVQLKTFRGGDFQSCCRKQQGWWDKCDWSEGKILEGDSWQCVQFWKSKYLLCFPSYFLNAFCLLWPIILEETWLQNIFIVIVNQCIQFSADNAFICV